MTPWAKGVLSEGGSSGSPSASLPFGQAGLSPNGDRCNSPSSGGEAIFPGFPPARE